jgi:hypothetical protein
MSALAKAHVAFASQRFEGSPLYADTIVGETVSRRKGPFLIRWQPICAPGFPA